MAKMIPSLLSPDIKSNAEKNIFNWFKNAPDTGDWVVLHSLGIVSHQRVIHGETDFLVLAPKYGMFALEVKGGRVVRKLGKWYFINRFGEIAEKTRGPFDQAWEGIYSIRQSVESKLDENHKYLKDIVFGIGVMFPDVEYKSVGVDEAQWQVFDIEDGQNVKDYIARLSAGAVANMKRIGYKVKEKMYPTASDIEYLADILRGDFDQEVPLKIQQKYTEEGLLSLTNEQALCIEQLRDNPRALIRGTAGTGKTLLAIEAVKQSIANGEKVALFCYNKLLGEWLEDYFSKVSLDGRPMYVGSFHRYMVGTLGSNGGLPYMIFEGDDDYYFGEVLPNETLKILRNSSDKFDRIIVDEAQDLLTNNYLEVMDCSLREGLSRGKWTLFGDFSLQSIYADNLTESKYLDMLQEKASFAIFRLTRNCRNAKKICVEIENIVGIKANVAFETVETPAVNHIIYTDMDEQKKHLSELLADLEEKSIAPKDIVILSPRRRENSVVSLLNGFNIGNYSVLSQGNIRFSTIQAFKGLESSTVILTDIENYQNDKLIYVGLSRARFSLYIFETEAASKERAKLFFQRRIANGR